MVAHSFTFPKGLEHLQPSLHEAGQAGRGQLEVVQVQRKWLFIHLPSLKALKFDCKSLGSLTEISPKKPTWGGSKAMRMQLEVVQVQLNSPMKKKIPFFFYFQRLVDVKTC